MLKRVNFRDSHVTLCTQHVRDLEQCIKKEFTYVHFERKSIFELFHNFHNSDWSDRSAFISLVTEHLLSTITNDCISFSKRAQCCHLESLISNMLHLTLCGAT